MAGLHGSCVFNMTKKAHSARFGTCHRSEIMRHKIRFADATANVADPRRAARGSLDWAHSCATLQPVVAQVGETQRMVANFCEMAERMGLESNPLYPLRHCNHWYGAKFESHSVRMPPGANSIIKICSC